jgi:hypothetical protein
MEGTPSQTEVLEAILEGRIRDIHVALPGRVDSYDKDKQTADVTPMVRRRMPGPEDEDNVFEDLPQLKSVPIVWPGGGDFFLTFPLAQGDTGQIIFNQWDPVGWRKSGNVSDPVDFRLHHPSHAAFHPGYRTMAKALSGLPTDAIALGKSGGLQVLIKAATMEVGGNSDAAALAAATKARLDKLQVAFDQHVHATAGSGPPVAPTAVPGVIPVGSLASVASSKLKLGG